MLALSKEEATMRKTDLPLRWRERIERLTDERYGLDYKHRGSLGASDFPANAHVSVEFPDGSEATFRYAFFIAAPEYDEVAVFTEHCGYHIFPAGDLRIEQIEVKWEHPGDDS
jgi:hypothetical protein